MPYLTRTPPDPMPIDERILSSALDLIVDKGFHNVSVHEVQRRAGVSIGSIYNYFGGKEGIAKALYYNLLDEMAALVAEVEAQELNATGRCNRLIERLFEYTETRRSIISFVLRTNHRQFLPDEPPICSASPFRAMRSIVEQGMAAGEIRDLDPLVASAVIFGPAIRLIHLRLDGLVPTPLPGFLADTLESIWSSMRNPKLAQTAPAPATGIGTGLG